METVIIVIHLMVIVALVAVVLMQRSEGGALGIGGASNFLSTRSQANVLTRSTAILAAAFFATSISLSLLARMTDKPGAILDTVPSASAPANTNGGTAPGGTMLDQLQKMSKPAPGATPPAGTLTPPAGTMTTPDAGTGLPSPQNPPAIPQVPTSQ